MIVVKVELWSAVDGSQQELARMIVDNVGGTVQRGDYRARTLTGRSEEALTRAMNASPPKAQRTVIITNHARLREHVWNLVGKALSGMGYGV